MLAAGRGSGKDEILSHTCKQEYDSVQNLISVQCPSFCVALQNYAESNNFCCLELHTAPGCQSCPRKLAHWSWSLRWNVKFWVSKPSGSLLQLVTPALALTPGLHVLSEMLLSPSKLVDTCLPPEVISELSMLYREDPWLFACLGTFYIPVSLSALPFLPWSAGIQKESICFSTGLPTCHAIVSLTTIYKAGISASPKLPRAKRSQLGCEF